MKHCHKCGTTKARSDFHANKSSKDGLQSYCGPCMCAVMTERHRQNRVEAIKVYGGKCVQCGTTEALEFDHVNGGGNVHRKTVPTTELMRRIARDGRRITDHELQLLCKPHHAEKTKRERLEREARKAERRAWELEMATLYGGIHSTLARIEKKHLQPTA